MICSPVLGKMCAYPHDVENQQKINLAKRDARTAKATCLTSDPSMFVRILQMTQGSDTRWAPYDRFKWSYNPMGNCGCNPIFRAPCHSIYNELVGGPPCTRRQSEPTLTEPTNQ